MTTAESSWAGTDIFGNRNETPTHWQHIADWERKQFNDHKRRMNAEALQCAQSRKARL